MKAFSIVFKIFCTWLLVVVVLSRCGILGGSPAFPYRVYQGSQSMKGLWKWSLNYTTGTFEALGDLILPNVLFDQTLSGTFSLLRNGFTKFIINNSSNTSFISSNAIAYGVELPGIALFIKPDLNFFTGFGNLIAAAAPGKCDGTMGTYNWIQSSIDSTFNNGSAPGRGTVVLSGSPSNYSMDFIAFTLGGATTGNVAWPGNSCSSGYTKIDTFSEGTGITANEGAMIFETYTGLTRAPFGFLQNSISLSDLANKEFIGFYMSGGTPDLFQPNGTNSNGFKFVFNSTGDYAIGSKYVSIDDDSILGSYYNKIIITTLANGALQGNYDYNGALQKPFQGVVHSYKGKYILMLVTENQLNSYGSLVFLISK